MRADLDDLRAQRLQGVAGILGVAALWGGTFPAMKHAFQTSDPMPFLAVRFAFASAALWAGMRLTGRRPRVTRWGAATGVLVFMGFAFQLEGLAGTSATKSAFITGLNAPLVPAIEYLAFGRRPSARSILAVSLGVVGLGLLTGAIWGIPLSRGDALTLVCAFIWAAQVVAVDRLARSTDPASLALSQFLPTLGLAALLSPLLGETSLPTTWPAAASAAYTGLLATALAFFLQAWAQARVPPEAAALGLLAEPVFAAAFSWALLGEALSLTQAAGAALILMSIPLSAEPEARESRGVIGAHGGDAQ